ncbi:hypothetical protein [Methylomicrobium sp. Wu6]|uniref:hypothetical protein n=1 Tax=Methylomicrobium sp. Wu6 TaxID=3107928 RepID=UPI002DD67983|nr:hypothetical protein [Methylomicrobium sp. Wu6]MEC4747427.1 hypothetical protein [Methylomicrobium sp. Wu6]
MFVSVFRLFLIIAALFSLDAPLSASEGDGDAEPVKAAEAGLPVVELDVQKQKLAGLQIITVHASAYQPEFAAYGKAINIQPLVAIRSQYRVALSEQKSANARLTQSGQSIRRTEELYRHGVSSKRIVQEQQSLWQTDKAQLEARRAQSDAVLEDARVTWGTELAEWAFATDRDRLSDFVSGRETLLLVTLPVGKELPAPDVGVFVDPEGNRGKADKAVYISPAPQIDQTVQGPSYFFRAGGKRIRPGMTVSVWLPEVGAREDGVTIPGSALIWSLDQAFVYVKTGQATFSRRLLADYNPLAGGYFVRDALKPGEEVVTVGGQMLLSEEFRAQIPDEDN